MAIRHTSWPANSWNLNIVGEEVKLTLKDVDDGHGTEDLLNLVVEVTGQLLEDKQAKVDTARKLWVPAVNAEETFGRWDFIELTDPWEARAVIRRHLTE